MKARTQEQNERRRAVRRRCYLKHRESILAYAAQYRAEHGDEIRAKLRNGKNAEYTRRYRSRHPEKARAMTQAWKDAHPEQRKATNAAWSKANPIKNRLKEHIRRSRKAATGGRLSSGIVDRLLKLQNDKCAGCGGRLSDSYEIDHIVPLSRGGANIDANVQLMHPSCNRSKGAKDPIAYMQLNGRLL